MFGSTASGHSTTSPPAAWPGPLALPAGDYSLAITASDAQNADNPAIGPVDVQLKSGGNYTAVANLDADGKPTANLFTNDASTIDAGKGKLTVRHTAAAPAVDVLAGGSPVIQGLSNPDEQTLTLDPGTISASVAAAGTTEPVIGPADIPVAEGTHTIVYAWGSLDDGNLAVAVQNIEGLNSAPGAVPGGRSGAAAEAGPDYTSAAVAGGALLLLLGAGAAARDASCRFAPTTSSGGLRSRWCLPGAPPASSPPPLLAQPISSTRRQEGTMTHMTTTAARAGLLLGAVLLAAAGCAAPQPPRSPAAAATASLSPSPAEGRANPGDSTGRQRPGISAVPEVRCSGPGGHPGSPCNSLGGRRASSADPAGGGRNLDRRQRGRRRSTSRQCDGDSRFR